jgi:hypothetical protein
MHRGYVFMWRKAFDTGLHKNHKAWVLWTWILGHVTHKPHRQLVGRQMVDLEPGQMITGRLQLAVDLGMTEKQVRLALDLLVRLENITVKGAKTHSLVTVVNWAFYQDQTPEGANKRAKTGPRQGQDGATNKNKNTEEHKDITPPSPLSGGCAPGCDDPGHGEQPEAAAEPVPVPQQRPKREPKPKIYDPDFEAIWFSAHELMRRCGKKAAGASWEKARKASDYPGQENVLLALKAYRAEQEAKVDPKVCHLSVWLNQGRWDTGQDVDAHEAQSQAQRNAQREAAQRREEEAEERRKEADKAWVAAWEKLPEDVKERWREYVIERNSMLAQAKEKGHTVMLDIMARGAWRKHKEGQIKAQRAA